MLTHVLHQNNPFPSVADAFYLATYPLLTLGLVGMVRARRREKDIGALLDALIVTAACALLSWIYLIQPYVHAHGMTLFQKIISIAYPLGDIAFLCVLVRLLLTGAVRNRALGLLTVGGVGVLAADVAYGAIQLNGTWKVGGPDRPGLGAVLRLLGRRRPPPLHARADGGPASPAAAPERDHPAGPEWNDPRGAGPARLAGGDVRRLP